MKILGIETSADDTGVALIEAHGDFGAADFSLDVLANEVSSQTIHAEYGGIYPNLAKREHSRNLPLLLEKVLADANLAAQSLKREAIVAVTVGPGLEPCLWEGIEFVKKLAAEWGAPVVPVNHMEGHVLISLMRNEEAASYKLQATSFPAIALLISGGHTELILMKNFGEYEYLGRTRDDAVGEAFDKVARMLGLPYPGGPAISALAEIARSKKQETNIKLPRPMIRDDSYDFSFSGLKTAVRNFVKEHEPLTDELKRGIAREFEDAAADVLVHKTMRALEEYGAETLIAGGGVSANKRIRDKFSFWAKGQGVSLHFPPSGLAGDNGLMIAFVGAFRAHKKEYAKPENLKANGALKLC